MGWNQKAPDKKRKETKKKKKNDKKQEEETEEEEESKVRIQGPRVHHLRLEHMNELDLQKPAENKLNQ